MGIYTKKDIISKIEEEDVEFIRLQFVDLFGTIKNMAVTTSQIGKLLDNRCKFDGAAIEGFTDDRNVDLYLKPDLDTFTIFPWRPQHGKVARFYCDIIQADGSKFDGDSRQVLVNVLEKARAMGYEPEIGSSCEFFLFDLDDKGEPTKKVSESGAYFDVSPVDHGENARREMVLFLEKMGFEVESSFHARERSQHGISFRYDNALKTADNIVTYKLVIRSTAKRHGFHASFMPKPLYGMNGSGMHLSFSIKKDGINIFNGEEPGTASRSARSFLAGILDHIEGMALINNPIVNSYKRLVPGYNAPVRADWAHDNRNALMRLSDTGEEGVKIKLRSADAASNPYLCLAVCIAAGLDGIERDLKPCKCLEEGGSGDKILPPTLEDAIIAFEKDEFIRGVLGEHISKRYIEAKTAEWNEYCKQITGWEVDRYLLTI